MSQAASPSGAPHKNRILALVLAMMLGLVGADRFYLGKHKSGFFKALTLGGLGLWWFIDGAALLLDAFTHSLGAPTRIVKDAQGRDLRYGLSLFRLQKGRLVQDWFRPQAQ